jgi:histidyl-tRNA synthetase
MPESRIRPDFRIARGLEYYTGTIYETFIQGHEDWGSICSGGRYDDLASFFSKQKFPGVGISIGLSRLLDLLVQSKLVEVREAVPTQVLVTTQDRAKYLPQYLALARTLRAEGIPTEVFLERGALREQFGYASSNGIAIAVIAGESEFAGGNVTIKDLVRRQQETIPQDSMVSHIHGKLAARNKG